MIRLLRNPHPATAARLRLTAFVVVAASILLVPAKFAAAATGHETAAHAFAWAVAAAVVAVTATVLARGLDPLRRR